MNVRISQNYVLEKLSGFGLENDRLAGLKNGLNLDKFGECMHRQKSNSPIRQKYFGIVFVVQNLWAVRLLLLLALFLSLHVNIQNAIRSM